MKKKNKKNATNSDGEFGSMKDMLDDPNEPPEMQDSLHEDEYAGLPKPATEEPKVQIGELSGTARPVNPKKERQESAKIEEAEAAYKAARAAADEALAKDPQQKIHFTRRLVGRAADAKTALNQLMGAE